MQAANVLIHIRFFIQGAKWELSCYFSVVLFLGSVRSGKLERMKNVTTMLSQSECAWVSPTDNRLICVKSKVERCERQI